jgi:hypothetical protein
MFRVVLLFVALAAICAQTLAPNICRFDSDCNTFATAGTMFCNVTNPLDTTQNICQTRATTAYGSSDLTGKTTCANSLLQGGVNCVSYSSPGCIVPAANTTYIRCLDSTRNAALAGACQAPNVTQVVWKNFGDRCDDSSTDPVTRCVNGLTCRNRVCQRTLVAGDNCAGTGLTCGPSSLYGLMCDVDVCVPAISKFPGERCHNSLACMTGICQDGRCMEARSLSCYTNSECSLSSDKVCYIPPGNTRGYCANTQTVLRKQLIKCILGSCTAETNTSNPLLLFTSASSGYSGCSACLPTYISLTCASYCTARADARAPTDGYIYNCQTNTRTVATGCEITQLVTGCDSFVPLSGSIAQSISLMVVLVATVLLTIL